MKGRPVKRSNILRQMMVPMILFIVLLILSNGIFLFIYNLQKNISDRYITANRMGHALADQLETYQGIEFLSEYWLEHMDTMYKVYEDPDQVRKWEKYLYARFPDISDISQITSNQVRALPDSGQEIYAEVCYTKLCKIMDSFKRSYKPLYLYTFQVTGEDIIFMLTGTLENEKRVSNGGEIYELGQQFPYVAGQYPVLDKVLQTNEAPDEIELSSKASDGSAVHTFVPVYGSGKMVMIIAVSLEWNDLIISALQPSIVVTIVSAVLFAALGASIYLLLRKTVVRPAKHEQQVIKDYESFKDAGLAVDSLKKITCNNEIQSLSESFSSMVQEIDRYIMEIREVTSEKERIGAELSMAASIQESQLPNIFPAFPDRGDINIYASMTPAKEVGGDFYDFFLIDEDHICLVIADVSGKGVPAALFMMISKILLKNHIMNGESPSEALFNVNNQLLENNEASLFVTVWVATIDLKTGKGIAANAGHEHPFLRRANGEYEMVVYRHSPPIGTYEGMMFREHEFQINPGDSIFVYTDGVAEASNDKDELFGNERTLEALNSKPDADPQIILNIVKSHIDEFVDEAEQFDDITMLGFKFNGPEFKKDRKDDDKE